MKAFQRFVEQGVRALLFILAVLLMIITVITAYQVVMRYAFNRAPYWSDEVVRFLFVWLSFLGAAAGVHGGMHIGIDIIANKLPPRGRLLLKGVISAIMALFGLALLWYGLDSTMHAHAQPSPTVGLPMSWVYASVPVCGALIAILAAFESLNAFMESGKAGRGALC